MADSRVSVLIDIRSKLAGLEKATAGFGRLIKGVAGFAAAYLSVRTVISGARDIIKLGADMDHLRSQTGVAVSDLIILRQAFEDNGISADNSRLAIKKMQKSLIEASEGLQEPTKAFQALGLSYDELLEKSPSEQFSEIGNAIRRIEDPAERAAAAMRIFGRAGAELQSLFVSGDIEDVTQIGTVQFGRVDWQDKVIRPAREFSTILEDQREGLELMVSLIKEQLNENLKESREILGLQGDELAEQVSATERMLALIDQQIAKRQLAADSEGLTPLGAQGTLPGDDSGELKTELEETGLLAKDTFNSVDSALRSGLSGSIDGLTMRTRTWRDALLNVSTTVRGALVQSFAQMTANWIADRIKMFVMGESLKQADTASTVAQEGAKQAAMQPTALLASIGSYGSAALIEAAVLTAVMASVGGFAEGGYGPWRQV